MKDYATDLISRGEINKLLCPHESGCKTFLTENNLDVLGVNAELKEKYTIFSINNAIDCMEDFGWCPIA